MTIKFYGDQDHSDYNDYGEAKRSLPGFLTSSAFTKWRLPHSYYPNLYRA